MAVLALSLGADLGLRRHPVLRPGGILRARRLHLRDRDDQSRREHAAARPGGARARRLRGAARLFHLLRPHQRRLSRRHHADGDADPVQFDQFDRRTGIPYRRRAARRLQRHPRHSRRSTCPSSRTGRSTSKACSICRPPRCSSSISGCARCWRAASAASSSASARTSGGRELLGYDPRAYKLATFTIGAALAGYAGCLFANWGSFVSPTIFGLAQSAQIIIWVIVGGRGTLIGPILGCVGIQWLTAALGANAPSGATAWTALLGNVPLILGAILVAFVLLVPKGLVPTLGGSRRSSLARPRAKARRDERAADRDPRPRHALRRRAGGARRRLRRSPSASCAA